MCNQYSMQGGIQVLQVRLLSILRTSSRASIRRSTTSKFFFTSQLGCKRAAEVACPYPRRIVQARWLLNNEVAFLRLGDVTAWQPPPSYA